MFRKWPFRYSADYGIFAEFFNLLWDFMDFHGIFLYWKYRGIMTYSAIRKSKCTYTFVSKCSEHGHVQYVNCHVGHVQSRAWTYTYMNIHKHARAVPENERTCP